LAQQSHESHETAASDEEGRTGKSRCIIVRLCQKASSSTTGRTKEANGGE
jgi:hypothetical protein